MVDAKHKLTGDCAIAAAFVSYCGPFNQEFRAYLVKDKFTNDCIKRGVPCTADIDVIEFSVDQATIADWNMEGLPGDPLSIQNGILITQASRYPLLIDPQGQALSWIKSREHAITCAVCTRGSMGMPPDTKRSLAEREACSWWEMLPGVENPTSSAALASVNVTVCLGESAASTAGLALSADP